MAKFSVCIETIFKDVAFEERIAKTKESGADAFEFWPYLARQVPERQPGRHGRRSASLLKLGGLEVRHERHRLVGTPVQHEGRRVDLMRDAIH